MEGDEKIHTYTVQQIQTGSYPGSSSAFVFFSLKKFLFLCINHKILTQITPSVL